MSAAVDPEAVTYVLAAGNPAVERLIAQARGLGGPVVAVVAGPESLPLAVASAGVDRVLWLGRCWTAFPEAEPGAESGNSTGAELGAGTGAGTGELGDDRPAEAYAPAVADLVVSQPGNVLAGRGPAERVWLGAAAAALDAPVLTGVAELGLVDGQVVAVREVGGGIGQETVAFDGLVCVMTEGRRPVEPLAGPQDSARAEVAQLAAGFYPMTVLQATPAPGPGVDLAAAKLVVGAGRGFACQGDLALAERLADAMGAAVACSRPLAEGLGWLPKDRYVGISGMQIAPDLYLAVGISGQLQHMGGVRGAGTIVAINKDPGAPIMAQADYVLAGDLYELLPALTAAVAGEQR